jgi:hypothetical protein
MAASCPTHEELQQFRLGRLSEDAARAVEQHLHGCGQCLSRLAAIPRDDPLVEGLRQASRRPAFTSPVLAKVQQELRALPVPRPAASGARFNSRWLIGAGIVAAVLGLIVFLAFPGRSGRQRKENAPKQEKHETESRAFTAAPADRDFRETWVIRPAPIDELKGWCIETNEVGYTYPTSFDLTEDNQLLIRYVTPAEPRLYPPVWRRFDAKTNGLVAAPFDGVYAALSPDTRTCPRVVAGGVQLWEVGHPVPRVTLRSPGPAYTASFSPDGKTIVTTNGPGRTLASEFWFWDAKQASKLGEHKLPIPANPSMLAWSRDSKALASPAPKGIVLIRAPWKESPRILERPRAVSTLAWSSKGLLATVEADDEVHVIDETGKDAMELPKLKVASRDFIPAWSPDGTLLAIATADKKVVIQDVEQKKTAFTFAGHTRDLIAVIFLKDKRTLVSASKGSVRFWNLRDNDLRGTLVHLARVGWLAISPDGHYRCSGGAEGRFVCKFRQLNNEVRELAPATFRDVHGWKNQPERVKLAGE